MIQNVAIAASGILLLLVLFLSLSRRTAGAWTIDDWRIALSLLDSPGGHIVIFLGLTLACSMAYALGVQNAEKAAALCFSNLLLGMNGRGASRATDPPPPSTPPGVHP